MSNFNDFFNEQMQNPEFKREYDKITAAEKVPMDEYAVKLAKSIIDEIAAEGANAYNFLDYFCYRWEEFARPLLIALNQPEI